MLSANQYFLENDADLDHLLSKLEFNNFLHWLLPHLENKEKEKMFEMFDDNRDGYIEYQEFKRHFHEAMKFTRVRNLVE